MKKLTMMPLAIIVAVWFATSSLAQAINYGGIGGRPAYPDPKNPRTQSIFIYQLKPGQSAMDGVDVQNNTNQQQTITLDAVDSELASGGNFTCRQAVEPKVSVGAWINLAQNSITLAANSHQIVRFTITVPASNVDVGEHDGCITIQASSQTAAPSSKSGIELSFRSAIRVAVTVPGKIIKKLSIQSLKVTPLSSGQYQVVPTLNNSGNVSLDVTQTIRLLSIFGMPLQSTTEGFSPALAHSLATQSFTIKHPFWGGLYRVQDVATYNGDPSTELGMSGGAAQTSVKLDSTLFFVAPTPLAAIIEIVLLLTVIAFIYWLIRRKQYQRHIRKTWRTFTVEPGDTLHGLAAIHNVSWKKIAQVNKLKPPYHLEKGKKVKLPTKRG